MNVKLTKDTCDRYHFTNEKHSWTTFVIGNNGDLYVYGDWGYYCYLWRNGIEDYGFKKFIIEMDPNYFIIKIDNNAELHKKAKLNAIQKDTLIFFFLKLKDFLKQELHTI